MADNDDTQGTDGEQEPSWAKRLRKENEEMKRELRDFRTRDALTEAGFDPKSPQAKALMKLHEGDLTADAVKATAGEYGIAPVEATQTEGQEQQVDEVAQQRSAATQNIDELRSNATPVGAQRTSWQDYQQLKQHDMSAATKLLAAGQVDVPPEYAAVLNANRADRASQIGA